MTETHRISPRGIAALLEREARDRGAFEFGAAVDWLRKLGVTDNQARAGSRQPRNPESAGSRRIRVRTERPCPVRVRQGAEEPLEPPRRSHHEQSSYSRYHSSVRMRNTARKKHHTAGMETELVVAALNLVLALKRMENLVLALMHMQWRVGHRRDFLIHRESPAGSLRRHPNEDGDAAEHKGLAVAGVERVAAWKFHSDDSKAGRSRSRGAVELLKAARTPSPAHLGAGNFSAEHPHKAKRCQRT